MAVKLKKAMSALVTAAQQCRWSGGQKAIEGLRKRLDEAESALAASEEGGDIPPVLKLQTLTRSRMTAEEIGRCVEHLVKGGHHEEGRRVVAICDRAAIEQMDAIARDGGKSARIRLIALAWLVSIDAARSAHGPLLHVIGTSIDRRDWTSARMGMDALQYLISRAGRESYGEPAWGKNALLSALEWPWPRAPAEEEDDDRNLPRWPAAAGGF